jgi:hypothetical protein
MKEAEAKYSEPQPIELNLGERVFPFKDYPWPKKGEGLFKTFISRDFVFRGIKGKVLLIESDLESLDFPVEFPLSSPVERSLLVEYGGELKNYEQLLLAGEHVLVFEIGEKSYEADLDGDNLVEDETTDFDLFKEALDSFDQEESVDVYSRALNDLSGPKEVKLPLDEMVKDRFAIRVERKWG